jgi:hypothetical protein
VNCGICVFSLNFFSSTFGVCSYPRDSAHANALRSIPRLRKARLRYTDNESFRKHGPVQRAGSIKGPARERVLTHPSVAGNAPDIPASVLNPTYRSAQTLMPLPPERRIGGHATSSNSACEQAKAGKALQRTCTFSVIAQHFGQTSAVTQKNFKNFY